MVSIRKRTLMVAIMGSLALLPAQRVMANGHDFLAGAIIGGILGANAKKKQPRRSTLPSTAEGREIQASLNYFGFPAGVVDGQLGSKSRSAISMYQAFIGFPSTGHLTPLEQSVLVSAFNRAQIGALATTQQIATHPEGVRGLLRIQLAEMTGTAIPNAGQNLLHTQPVADQMPMPTEVAAPAVEEPASPALPNFLGGGQQGQSLALHCNTVNLVTNSNGGFVTLANMTDPGVALNEQFCLARSYAMSTAEADIAKIQGFTPDQITAQCEGLGPTMKPHIAALSLQDKSSVLSSVGSFVLSSGIQPQQLAGMAKICLGVGYRLDNMEVAVGSALLLVALGEGPYAELMGHHLSQGIGAAKRIDLAQVWYADAIKAVQTGQGAVFSPGAPERTDLILQAAYALDGSGPINGGVSAAPGLPTFGTNGN